MQCQRELNCVSIKFNTSKLPFSRLCFHKVVIFLSNLGEEEEQVLWAISSFWILKEKHFFFLGEKRVASFASVCKRQIERCIFLNQTCFFAVRRNQDNTTSPKLRTNATQCSRTKLVDTYSTYVSVSYVGLLMYNGWIQTDPVALKTADANVII